jgi:pimeloyl-ACP methyl ester carboxylesterase
MKREVIEVGGADLEAARWPVPDGRRLPVLLLHEGLGSIALWREFPAKLAEATGREVIAWSRRGHGWSGRIAEVRNPDYMHREAALLPELFDRLGIARAHLLGHSDGASIALIATALHPELVASLMLEAPHVFVEDISVDSIGEIGRTFEASDLPSRMARYHADPVHIFRKWNDIWLLPAFRDWNIEDLLPSISAKTLLIQGRNDEYGTLAQLDRIAGAMPQSERLELDACRHSPHRDREPAVLAAIEAFLRPED